MGLKFFRALPTLGLILNLLCCAESFGAIRAKSLEILRSIQPPEDGTLASVSGYYAPGDGGGGKFRWHANSDMTADGSMIIASDQSATGRWLRIIPRTLTPKIFGAKGNGIHDDAPHLRQTFAWFARDGRSNRLHFPRGNYFLDSTVDYLHPDGAIVIIPFGHEGMTDRRLHISGTNATLFSNISPQAAPILFVRAGFRSLRVSGITFEKTSRPLKYTEAPAEGLNITSFDRRNVDLIRLNRCRFINCHRSFSAGLYLGNRHWRKVSRFEVLRCEFLYPYGANGEDGATAYTGHQMTSGTLWIDTMVYRNCLFNGASTGSLNEETCPGFRLMDGAHFGGPQTLIFEHNIVKHFSVEGVFQTDDRVPEVTLSSFFIPPADDVSVEEVTIQGRDSEFPVGSRFRIRDVGNFVVVAHDSAARILRFSNPGEPSNLAAGELVSAGRLIDDLNHPRSFAWISNNVFDGSAPLGASTLRLGHTGPGSPAIAVHDSYAWIFRNRIEHCQRGIALYAERVPGVNDTKGSIILENEMRLSDPRNLPGNALSSGIYTQSGEVVIHANWIESPASENLYGIYTTGIDTVISENRITAVPTMLNGYASPRRSIGVLLGNSSAATLVFGNRTENLDVGVGPEPFQEISFSVGSFQSDGDGLAIDFRQSTSRISPQNERSLRKEILEQRRRLGRR